MYSYIFNTHSHDKHFAPKIPTHNTHAHTGTYVHTLTYAYLHTIYINTHIH